MIARQALSDIRKYLAEILPGAKSQPIEMAGDELSSVLQELEEYYYYRLSLLRGDLSAVEWIFYLRSFPTRDPGCRVAIALCESIMSRSRRSLRKCPSGVPTCFELDGYVAFRVISAIVLATQVAKLRNERLSSYFSGRCIFYIDDNPSMDIFSTSHRDEGFVNTANRISIGDNPLAAFGHVAVKSRDQSSYLLACVPVLAPSRVFRSLGKVPMTQLESSDVRFMPRWHSDRELLSALPRDREQLACSVFSPEMLSAVWLCWTLSAHYGHASRDYRESLLLFGGALLPVQYVEAQMALASDIIGARIECLGLRDTVEEDLIGHLARLANMPIEIRRADPPPPILTASGWAWVDAVSAGMWMLRAVGVEQQGAAPNVRSKYFEKSVQELVDETRWKPDGEWRKLIGRKIRWEDKRVITDIDCVAKKDGTVILIDAKSVLPRVSSRSMTRKEARNASRRMRDIAIEWQAKVADVSQRLACYGVYTRGLKVVGVAVVPSLAYSDEPEVGKWVLPGLHAVVTPGELKMFLERH